MPKNIILLSDGTGNSSAKLSKTNVWRTYQALDLSDSSQQVAYYDNGVGTSNFRPYALLGGALGLGLARNVRDLYTFLCKNWQPEDRIYCFGFSRGAFTVRVLCGMIATEGIAKYNGDNALLDWKVRAAFRSYRKKRNYQTALSFVARPVRDALLAMKDGGKTYDSLRDCHQNINIEFLGVWDTVAAYGLPIEELTNGWDKLIWPLSMPDRNLSAKVKRACHALSLDDERKTFHPVLWNELAKPTAHPEGAARQEADKSSINEERLTQVWFTGAHSNVGGGYSDDSLAYVPLCWMMEQAKAKGLQFEQKEVELICKRANAIGPANDPRRGFGSFYRYQPRRIDLLTDGSEEAHGVKVERAKIHHTVFDRMKAAGGDCSLIVLPPGFDVVGKNGKITKGDTYFPVQTQAHRAERQEAVWDEVWKRRVAYFSAIFVTFWLAFLPVLPKGSWLLPRRVDGVCEASSFCALTDLYRMVGRFVPAFLEPWINAFSSNPGRTLLGFLLLGALVWQGSQLATKIGDGIRPVWHAILEPKGLADLPSIPQPGWIRKLRMAKSYQAFFRLLRRQIFPYASGILMLLAIVYGGAAVLSRAVFTIADGSGAFCEATKDAQPVTDQGILAVAFDGTNACQALGLTVVEGQRYRVAMKSECLWFDKGTEADLGGLSAEAKWTPAHYAGVLFKRHIGSPYLKPVLRIGERGADEYPLDPVVAMPSERPDRHELVSDFTAQSTGELFLYVNDAVVFWPDFLFATYANNRARANVTVERLDGSEGLDAPESTLLPDCS